VPWSYAAQIPLNATDRENDGRWIWARLDVQVRHGQVGIGLFADNDICNERLICPADGRIVIHVRITHRSAAALMIRNGSIPGSSVIEIFDATAQSCVKP
jgi:hypothetical protein